MRNWNINRIINHVYPLFCFYSTYEELKLKSIIVCMSSALSFYSTYEELKLSTPKRMAIFIASFYSTYEELKLLSNCANPLRDLQSFYSTYEELKLLILSFQRSTFILFLQYLWGIETMISILIINPIFLFLQYLWGIETMREKKK